MHASGYIILTSLCSFGRWLSRAGPVVVAVARVEGRQIDDRSKVNGGGYTGLTGIVRDDPAALLTRLTVIVMMASPREIRPRKYRHALTAIPWISWLASRPNVSTRGLPGIDCGDLPTGTVISLITRSAVNR